MTRFVLFCSELSFPKKAKGDLCFHVFAQPTGHCELSLSMMYGRFTSIRVSLCCTLAILGFI